MSDRDTDDTDALLNADPNGGLDMFLGLSLSELAEKHKKILSSPGETARQKSTTTEQEDSSEICETDKDSVGTNSTLNNLESDDRSDFFNSKGELVLSGLSEWSDSESQDTRTSNVENDEDDQSEDGGSESSFTYQDSQGSNSNKKELELLEDNVDAKTKVVEVEKELQSNLTIPEESKALEVYRDNNEEKSFVGNDAVNNSVFKSCTGFGVAVMNGTAGCHSVFQGYSGQSIPQGFTFGQAVNINLLRPSAGWNIPMPRFPNGGEPMFTRAPNFRLMIFAVVLHVYILFILVCLTKVNLPALFMYLLGHLVDMCHRKIRNHVEI